MTLTLTRVYADQATLAAASDSLPAYNLHMARGWESKSVEQQQEEVVSSAQQKHTQLTPEQIVNLRRRQSLQLSRQHILQQLKVASNPKHRSMLERALADLDAQLTANQ